MSSTIENQTFLELVKPVILINQFLGVCPYEIRDGNLHFKWKSKMVVRTVVTILVLFLYFLFTSYQLIKSIHDGNHLIQIAVLGNWVTGTLFPINILLHKIKYQAEIRDFFTKTENTKVHFQGLVNPKIVGIYGRRLYVFYIFLASVSTALVVLDAVRRPTAENYILYYFPNHSRALMVGNCIFQSYIIVMTHATCASVEVLCATFSRNTVDLIQKTKAQMKIQRRLAKIPDVLQQNYFEINFCVKAEQEKDRNLKESSISEGLSRFGALNKDQRAVNRIFGKILGLTTIWLAINVCVLVFLLIRHSTDAYEGVNTGNAVTTFFGHGSVFIIRLLIVLTSLGNVHERSRAFDALVTRLVWKTGPAAPGVEDVRGILAHLVGNQSNPLAYSAGGYFIFSKSILMFILSAIITYLAFLLQQS